MHGLLRYDVSTSSEKEAALDLSSYSRRTRVDVSDKTSLELMLEHNTSKDQYQTLREKSPFCEKTFGSFSFSRSVSFDVKFSV